MIVAMMYPEGGVIGAGRGKTSVVPQMFPMVSKSSLYHARKVLRLAGDLAPGVLNGSLSHGVERTG
jgi:hypothetical protein